MFSWYQKQTIATKTQIAFNTISIITIVIVLSSIWQIKSSQNLSNKLTNHQVPTAQNSLQVLNGINHSLSSLRGWILLGESKFKEERANTWKDDIFPALNTMHDISKYWENPKNVERLKVIQQKILRLETYQHEIEEIANIPSNLPAHQIFFQDALPQHIIMTENIKRIINLEVTMPSSSKRKKLFNTMSSFNTNSVLSLSNIRTFIITGNIKYYKIHTEIWQKATQQLTSIQNMQSLLSQKQKVFLANLHVATNNFSSFIPKILLIRNSPQWNKANYLFKTKASPMALLIQNELNTMIHNQENLLQEEIITTKEHGEQMLWILSFLLFFILLMTLFIQTNIVVAIKKSVNELTNAVKDISEVLNNFSDGNFSARVTSNYKGDYELIKTATNTLGTLLYKLIIDSEKIKKAALENSFTPRISSENYHGDFQKITDAINETMDANEERQWVQNALDLLNVEVLGDYTIEEVSRRPLHVLCNYIHAGIGSLYLFHAKKQVLDCVACYALDKNQMRSFTVGVGTIGQVALQKSPIHLKNNIQTANENSSLSAPHTYTFSLIYKEELLGVIEIGSNQSFNSQTIKLFELSSTIMATALATTKQAQSVKTLLQKAENINATMLQQQNALDAHSIVGITNVQGTITYANSKFSEVSGYSNEELVGSNHRLVNSGVYDNDFWDDMYKTVSSGQVWHHPAIKNKAKDGSTYWVDTTIFPFMDIYGKPESYIAIRTDVTKNQEAEVELREAKEQAELAAISKTDFLASMSHEIRTPMNGVIGMLDLLSREALTKQQLDNITIADASAKSLLSVINDILDFSKIEAGKVELENIEFDAKKELGNFAKSIAITVQNDDVELLLDLSNLEQTYMYADIGRLKQILNNLVGNAIKFTHQGNIIIKAHLDDIQKNQAKLIISVEDSGIGIAQEKLNKIFEAFTQADSSTTRQYGGTGLGLSIARNLVECMNGSINVSSTLDEGSNFTFSIDVTLSNRQPPLMPYADIRGQKILIVDDNIVNIKILTAQLQLWDIEVTPALSAAEAIEICNTKTQETCFDIAILDMQMPKKDGETLGEELSAMSICKNMKMIMMTSFGRHTDLNKLYTKGFHAFFMKPTTTSDLYNALLLLVHGHLSQYETSTLLTNNKINSLTPQDIAHPEKLRILLVEDNHINQLVAQGMLDVLDLQADIANNGEEAIHLLKTSKIKYDLLLLDCQMPVLDGFETTTLIRQGECGEEYSNVPIIAMTANAMKGDKEKCLNVGMDDYISKPIVTEFFKDLLIKWLPDTSHQTEDLNTTQNYKELPIWDEKEITSRLGGSQKLLKKIIEVFISDIQLQIKMLKDALTNNNIKDLILCAHTIKGSSGNMSALRLQSLAKSLENTAKINPTGELHSTYLLIQKESKVLIKLFNEYLQKNPSSKQQSKISKQKLKNSLKSLKNELVNGSLINTEENILFNSYFNDDLIELLHNLKESIDSFSNDEALITIDKILQELGDLNG